MAKHIKCMEQRIVTVYGEDGTVVREIHSARYQVADGAMGGWVDFEGLDVEAAAARTLTEQRDLLEKDARRAEGVVLRA